MQAVTESPTKANFEIQEQMCDLSSGQSVCQSLQLVYDTITASGSVAFSLCKCKVAVYIPTANTRANTIFY